MRGQEWSREEDDCIRKNYPHENTKTIADYLNRSVDSVRHRARRFGLKKTKEALSAFASRRKGENSGRWHGGQFICDKGYRNILMQDHPNAKASGYVAEHRLVMEFVLARLLASEEVVHHRDGNRLNNVTTNLFVFPDDSTHAKFHQYQRYNSPEITEEKFMALLSENPTT